MVLGGPLRGVGWQFGLSLFGDQHHRGLRIAIVASIRIIPFPNQLTTCTTDLKSHGFLLTSGRNRAQHYPSDGPVSMIW